MATQTAALKPLPVKSLLRYWGPPAVWLALIVVESTDALSAAHTGGMLSHLLTAIFGTVSMTAVEALNHVLRKTGHFVGYAVLSWLMFRALRGTCAEMWEREEEKPPEERRERLRLAWMAIAAVFTFLVASADEAHQAMLPGRTGVFTDVLLDTAGALFAQFALIALNGRRNGNGSS